MRTPLLLTTCAGASDFLRGATQVQLAGCNSDCGRLEVQFADDGEWRAVTARNWTFADATATCARLGFGAAAAAASPFASARARGDRAVFDEGRVRKCVSTECDMPAVGVACRERVRRPRRETAAAQARVDAWAPQRAARLRTALRRAAAAPRRPALAAQLTAPLAPDALAAARAIPLDARDRTLQRRTLEFLGRHPGATRALSDLVARGLLAISAAGVVLHNNISAPAAELAYGAFLGADPRGDVHWELDGRRRLGTPSTNSETIRSLRRDGFARVEDWGFLTDRISQKARRSLHGAASQTLSRTSGGRVSTSRAADRRLGRFFRGLVPLASAYLGAAELAGYKVVHLDTQNDTESYVAGLWHHDRVGSRLKAFVFLHDVDCAEGHPTEVARGTHALHYYRTDAMGASRFADRYVRGAYAVEKLCGAAGGGFLVDTHALHRGAVEGSLPRTVVVGEYHAAGKCAVMDALGLGLPCPSGDQFLVR